MDEKYIASIDQGTTGTRFIVFTQDGSIAGSSYAEHNQIYPKPGWVEHDPLEIWQKTQIVMNQTLETTGINAEKIVSIGVTNQRETTVIWDRHTGKPLCNAIVWQCTRTGAICQQLIGEGWEETVKKKTGLIISTYFSGPKIRWIMDNVLGAKEKAENGQALFGTIDTWIIWNLTGGSHGGSHVTDCTNASRTMLMNLRTLDWDEELLEALKIPRQILPEIRPSSDKEAYGATKRGSVFGREIPISGDLGDQQAALFGQACFDVGETKSTYGTGNFCLMNTGDKPIYSQHGLLSTCAYSLEEGKASYALEGSVAIAGAAVQWLRDNLGLIKTAAETEEIARSVPDSGGVYFVPAFSGLFAPYWDMSARGCIVGLTRFTAREHLVRATLEAICYQTRDVLEAMAADTKIDLSTLKVDGGASANNFLMQLQADILGINIIRPRIMETTALGAANAAGLANGIWKSFQELKQNWKTDRIFEPRLDEETREAQYRSWRRAVERSLNWIEK